MMKLYLIRHSLTEANERRLYCGSTDLPLSQEGIELCIRLRDSGGYPSPERLRVITSGMRRTDETLRLLFGDVAYEADSRLREMDFGKFEMHSYDELKSWPDYLDWITADDPGSARCPGGECSDGFSSRVISALGDISEDTLIVCHGGVIAAIMSKLFPGETKTIYEWQPPAAGGYMVITENGKGISYSPLPQK